MWKPDRQGHKPLYIQIADHLERRIREGEFPPGSPLPSERKLSEQLGVNRSTVVLAYAELRSHGIIETLPGSRTQVSGDPQELSSHHTPPWHDYTEGGNFAPNLPYIRRIREMLEQSPSAIDFASNKLSVDLSPIEEINRLVKSYFHLPEEGYDSPQGFLPLRQALVSFLREYRGIRTTESSIVITTSSQQSIYLIMQCLLSPGDAVGVEDPSYYRSLSVFRSAGLKLIRLPVDEHGMMTDDLYDLCKKHRIKMLFVNPNFQNPTGTVLSRARRSALLDTASELGLPVIEEDSLSLTSSDTFPPSLKAADRAATVLYTGSFSKIAASGLRIGWIVAPQSVIQRLSDARRQLELGFSVIPQKIAAQFLESPYFTPHLERLHRQLVLKRDLMAGALQRELSGLVEFTVPQGGLHLWCRIIPEIRDGRMLSEALKRNVAFVPGSVYGAKSGYMRLSYSRPQAVEIEPGIARLAEALRAVLE
ncbi:DNA-binding transcriptional MocR family regulator [Paenibacillus rhizosphaerae]|uniref:DNA-binding transcriptional MocR family regulator n=1 Tax=Paenibacillus rhizosphaerae TaxID=297318 RepID=A0A839TQ32_9BACL|nr:PLP-dependent aminotransferase family protein [Paenibacillus rhizosphaerae]MBB3128623.1 DNA-binding transcriptional MocR family regulator [Paenibacillus rhizosphaerae]